MIYQYEPLIKQEYAEAVKNQISSGWVGPGKKTTEFEKRFAALVGSKHAIAATSGTTALLVSLLAANVHKDDEVILSDYSFIAAANVVRFLKAKSVLLDIRQENLCLDPKLLDKAVTDRTKAVIFINHNGYVGERLVQTRIWCYEHKIAMIEDAACGVGQWDTSGIHAGVRGDLGCFSFSVPKLITTGQGGMIVTNNGDLAKKCREWVDQGSTTWRQDGLHKDAGINFKFNDIAAAYGLAQLECLDELCSIRYTNFKRFVDNGVFLYYFPQGKVTGPWMNITLCNTSDKLIEKLAAAGYQAKKMYRPIHHSFTPERMCYEGTEPLIEQLWQDLVYLPSSLNLTYSQIDEISEIVLNCEEQYNNRI